MEGPRALGLLCAMQDPHCQCHTLNNTNRKGASVRMSDKSKRFWVFFMEASSTTQPLFMTHLELFFASSRIMMEIISGVFFSHLLPDACMCMHACVRVCWSLLMFKVSDWPESGFQT